jgi:hypothetical protein
MTTAALLRTPDEINSDWLAATLDRDGVELLATERIGTGQMSQSHRVTFSDSAEGDGSVVVKLASDDPTSRATGVGLGAYWREIAFYRNLAARIGGPLAACHLAEYDEAEGWFTLVLDDVSPATQGDQIRGCTVEEARLALLSLARVQAPVLGDLALGTADWLNLGNPLTQQLLTQLLPGFLERFGDRVAPEHAEVCERFVGSIDAWYADLRPPLGIVHGDYRLDNLLFGDGTCTVVDWQTVSWGPALRDASYFLGSGLSVDDRRAHEEDLLREYHEALLAGGVKGLDWETCWEEYRRQVFLGLIMVIAPAALVVQTERGDDMFMASLERFAQQALDLESLDLLPAASAEKPPPLEPGAEDEGRHSPGAEALWNESWYFDGVSDDGSLGVYLRLGRLPNQDLCLYTACVCGPGRDTVMLVDAAAPLPAQDDDAQRIDTETLRAEQHCEEPLRRFSVKVDGSGAAHADPAAPLRGEAGEPVAVALDLTWETDGVPYQWRQSTRYEIPCRVSGTVRVGDEEMVSAGPGPRSPWGGPRDWWATDWMWSGLHFDDGRRLHAVGIPTMPGYGIGYVQAGGELAEIESVTMSEDIAPDGLVASARIETGPDGPVFDVEPIAYGPLLLEAPDGRVSHFVRAMCRIVDESGATGTGWIEWNRNQR